MLQPIENRRDLARHLQAQMEASRYSVAHELDDEAEGKNSVKTYLLEAHTVEKAGDDPVEILSQLGKTLGFQTAATGDQDLVTLRDGDHDFWCDTSLKRYWRLHAMAPVKLADKLTDRLVSGTTRLDRVWLAPNYLENLSKVLGGRLQTFSLRHDRRKMRADEDEYNELDFVSMRLWSSRAHETLGKLRKAAVFPHGMSVRSVQVRREIDDHPSEYAVAEFFQDGKVTASGTSFDLHSDSLLLILTDYRKVVTAIEDRFGIGVEPHGPRGKGATLTGEPFTIEIKWTTPSLEYTVGKIFSSVEPFRLWGIPQKVGPDHFRARAVDLHVGAMLTFDITPKHVVIQLPRGACGNTIVRFLSALQYHLNSDVADDLYTSGVGPWNSRTLAS